MHEAFLSSTAAAISEDRRQGTGADLASALREAEDARERAEAALEAKSRLLATMSHEIRTPLNGMVGCADLLSATDLAPEQRAYVDTIRASGRGLAALIDEILDLSKIEAGKIMLAEAPFDLALMVESSVEILAPRAHAKGLDIASFVSASVPTHVVGDSARMRQILLNLLGNAVKFTSRGGVGLRVGVAGEKLRFVISDTGPGVCADKAAFIFDAFAQAALREADGSGLGLTISRQLAARMGGKIELEKNSPQGATFVLTVPLAAATSAAATQLPIARRILIVSPSSFEAPFLVERLSDLGLTATRAATLKSGLAAIAQSAAMGRRPDTLIADCTIGDAAVMELAAAGRAAGIPQKLVLFTAAERRGFAAESMAAFDGWLVKPLRLRSLLARFEDDGAEVVELRKPAARIDLAGCRILIAEDNDINALILQKHLSKTGARVDRINDGTIALHAAQTAPFDAIILDLRMPGLDGLALAQKLRRLETDAGRARCRLIAVSADTFADTKLRAQEAGVDIFLTKPIDFTALDAALASVPRPSR